VIDKDLFMYLTKKAGYSLQDVAAWWGVGLGAVYKRLCGQVELRRSEMEIWMQKVGVADAGPIFFARTVANTLPTEAPAAR
jgi:hypothetical protein